jgi:hypothetical protein
MALLSLAVMGLYRYRAYTTGLLHLNTSLDLVMVVTAVIMKEDMEEDSEEDTEADIVEVTEEDIAEVMEEVIKDRMEVDTEIVMEEYYTPPVVATAYHHLEIPMEFHLLPILIHLPDRSATTMAPHFPSQDRENQSAPSGYQSAVAAEPLPRISARHRKRWEIYTVALR